MSSARKFMQQACRNGTLSSKFIKKGTASPIASKCPTCRQISQTTIRPSSKQPADSPDFVSLIDNPPILVRAGKKKHGAGLIVLGRLHWGLYDSLLTLYPALIPLTAFALGTWQVQRLGWKSRLMAKLEDRLVRDPLPLPPHIDPNAISEFDYRRVYATGHFRHDQEMLIGPRLNDGKDGYLVITPLEREGDGTTVLVNRGWIPKDFKDQNKRLEGMERGEVTVEGLLREPWKKNMFTPDNNIRKKEFYFPDVKQMAALTGSQAVWIEQTMGMSSSYFLIIFLLIFVEPDLLLSWDRASKGIPIGRAAEINIRNNHAQYIFTWYFA